MTMLDDIRRDREAGTPGPWWFDEMSGDVCDGNNELNVIAERLSSDEDARRIARVPDMEAALLAAGELAKAFKEPPDGPGWYLRCANAVSAFDLEVMEGKP